MNLNTGTLLNGEILRHLGSDRALVRIGGEQIVMQFNRTPLQSGRFLARVMHTETDLVEARLLDQEYSLKELIQELNLPANTDPDRLEQAVNMIRRTGIMLNTKNVTRLLLLMESLSDKGLALAVLVSALDPAFIQSLLKKKGGGRASRHLENVEKFIIHSLKSSETLKEWEAVLRTMKNRESGDLACLMDFFSPGRIKMLLQEPRKSVPHFRSFLLDLQEQAPHDHPVQDDLASLLARSLLDDLKSIQIKGYRIWYFSLYAKDEKENWRETGVQYEETDQEIRLTLMPDLISLGKIKADLLYGLQKKTRKMRISAPKENLGKFQEAFKGVLPKEWDLEWLDETVQVRPVGVRKIDMVV